MNACASSSRFSARPACSGRRGAAQRRVLARAADLDITKMAPIADRILVKPGEEQTVSTGGVILTGTQPKGNEMAQIGEVLAVGDLVETKVQKGDTIVYQKYGTSDVEAQDGKVVFVQADSVLGVCA